MQAETEQATAQGLLADEQVWRQMPCGTVHVDDDRIAIGHWTDARVARRELTAPVLARHYTVGILLGSATIDCYKDGRLLDRGTGGPGGLQLTAPGEQVRCAFRGANEALHLFLPLGLVESEYGGLQGRRTAPRFDDPAFRVDPALVAMARSLAASVRGGHLDALHEEELVQAVLRHVLSRYARERTRATSVAGLSPARLRRVIDYIDANLAEPITLQDIARHAGLSRMYFAAQFRLATGFAPHAFLRARRIERSMALLMQDRPLVEVALAVGFQGQAHFSTVFRELNGVSPARWRARQRMAWPVQ